MWNLLREIANARPGKLTDSIARAGTDLTNSDTESGATWMAQMDEAAASHNMSIQFCMMNPCHALQSTLMKQMTNGRATWDNHREYNGVFTMGQNGLLYWCGTTMRLPLIGKNRSIFIGNSGLFWIYFYRLYTNA